MKERFMKNGVFSLEYDKETLKDMVLELQEENKQLKEVMDKINHILNNQINYREFVDIVNAIEDIVKGVSE